MHSKHVKDQREIQVIHSRKERETGRAPNPLGTQLRSDNKGRKKEPLKNQIRLTQEPVGEPFLYVRNAFILGHRFCIIYSIFKVCIDF